MTPESQGGAFNSSIELHQSAANQLTADVSNGSVKDGVTQTITKRTGFEVQTSLMDQLDLFWTHTGGGNSLLGGKFQFAGTSKTAGGAGHKMALSLAMGGNKHETETKSVEFELTGQEYQLLYGYRINEYFLFYSNLAYSRYNFAAEIHSKNPFINGLKPEYETTVYSLYGGMEVSLGFFFVKLESGYQQMMTTYTDVQNNFIFGYAMGVTF
jgi:hypothetical protein